MPAVTPQMVKQLRDRTEVVFEGAGLRRFERFEALRDDRAPAVRIHLAGVVLQVEFEMLGFIAQKTQEAILRPAKAFQPATEVGDPSKDDALLKGFHHGLLRGSVTEEVTT